MPPVLLILWESGRTVVSWGLALRVVVAVLPFAVAKVAQYIITDIAGVLRGTHLPSNFWALVATEVALNVCLGLITRAIDYSDSLLANRYTQHVSVRVMEQAARLDLTTYEDPVFYDRLERARVKATDRLAMIPRMGCLRQAEGRPEGAKEEKLFGLKKFFTSRFQSLAHQIYVEDVALSRSKLI